MTREQKRKAFSDGQGNLKVKRLIPVAGGAMELAIVSEGANGRTVLVAKSDERPTDAPANPSAATGGGPEGGAAAAAEPAKTPVQKTKGGVSTAASRVQETVDNPIGAGTDLTLGNPQTMGTDPGPELPGYVDESADVVQAMKGGTPWQRMKSMFKALISTGDELEAEEAQVAVAAKADGGVEADASAPDFKAVIAAVEAVGITRMAENALYDTICNVAWSYELSADEKKTKLTEAAQAFADYVAEKLKAKSDGAPADFGPKLKAALKSARAAAEPQIREAIKAAFPETESTTEDDDMDEKQVQAIAAKAAKDAVDAAVIPLTTGMASLVEALKHHGLPDGAAQGILAQMPGNGGGAAPDKVVEGAVEAAKADGPTVAQLVKQVGDLSAEVLKLRSTVLPGNGDGGGGDAPRAEAGGPLLEAFGDFDIASQHVSG